MGGAPVRGNIIWQIKLLVVPRGAPGGRGSCTLGALRVLTGVTERARPYAFIVYAHHDSAPSRVCALPVPLVRSRVLLGELH